MLALRPGTVSEPKKLIPNLLPCTIAHSGPISLPKRYWNPTKVKKPASSTSHFRGRLLRSRNLVLPEGYVGAVLRKTDQLVVETPETDELAVTSTDERAAGLEEEDGTDEDVECKTMEVIANFDEVVVWGHDEVVGEDNEYVRGVEEWIAFAEAMHGDSHRPSD